jgi:hypothetical protein
MRASLGFAKATVRGSPTIGVIPTQRSASGGSSPGSVNSGFKDGRVGGDEGYGHQLMDRMAEQDFHLRRVERGMVEPGRAIDRTADDPASER